MISNPIMAENQNIEYIQMTNTCQTSITHSQKAKLAPR